LTAALPPGPRAPALVQTLWWARDPIGYVERARARYGPIWTSRLSGFPPLVHLSDPEAIQEVWKGDPEVMLAGEANRVLEPILGSASLFLLDGAAHLRERRMLAPPFHGGAIASYARIFEEVTERALARWPRGRAFSLSAETQALTLDVILEAVLGLARGHVRDALREDLAALLDGATHPAMLLRPLQREALGLSPWGRLMRRSRKIDARLFALVDERRAAPSEGHVDLLSLLAAAKDEDGAPMSRTQLRDELVTLIVAGHDTVASGLAWALHHLSCAPDALARAQAEVDAQRDASTLPYVDAVVKEALRLTPVLPIVARRATRDVRIGGVTIPRGARAAPNVWLSHREPAAWPDPLRFSPERFLGARAPSASTYFPFGGGVRRCIGASFATAEMRAVLAAILARVEPVAAPGPPIVPVRRGVALVPSRGMPILIRDRAAAR
jgi:cytochrome P450